MSSKLKELVVNNTVSFFHLDFAHISAFPAYFSGPLQQLNFIRKRSDGKLHILDVCVDMDKQCLSNKQMNMSLREKQTLHHILSQIFAF